MNINFARNRGLIIELRRIAAAVERSNELKELELQNVHSITTRTTAALPADLDATKVAYNDPRYEELVWRLESEAGRKLSDEEAEKVAAALLISADDES